MTRVATDQSRFEGVVAGAVLVALSLTILVAAAVAKDIAQDWMPFRVAASLAPSARWSDIYPSSDITSLFDVTPAFRAAAAAQIEREGPTAIPDNALTAFVSPPPAAFLLVPLSTVSSTTALALSRLALALPLVAAIIAFAILGCRDSSIRLRWSLLSLAAAPLFLYTVGVGQPSAWLVPAVVASTLAVSWVEVLGGIALGLVIVTKASPLVVALGLLLIARRRLAGAALALTMAAVVVTAPLSGFDAWDRFLALTGRISGSAISDWNNASIDAEALRWLTGHATGFFTPIAADLRASLIIVKLMMLGVLVWIGWRGDRRARVSTIWIGWLVLSPVVWLHYLIVLVPIAGAVLHKRPVLAIVAVASLSIPLFLHSGGASALAVGHTATAVWLGSTAILLWPRNSEGATSAR